MLLKIFKNRTVSSSGTWGTKNENNYEILDFEFPEELEEYNKRIVYYLDNKRVWDLIVNNKVAITNAVTTKEHVKAYIWLTLSETITLKYVCDGTEEGNYYFTYDNVNYYFTMPEVEENDELIFDVATSTLKLDNTTIATTSIGAGTELTFETIIDAEEDFRTQLFKMNFYENENADGIVPTPEQVDGFNTMLTAMNEKIEEIDELETTIENAETQRQENEETRQNNEDTRQENEQTRQEQEAERERRTDEAIGEIEDLTEEYNQNAQQKTEAFNNNATQKTDDFNSNAESKTSTFNTNATNKTNNFNNNASSKTSAFNENATSKTNTFNSNANDKTSAFNDNATQKTTNFDNNASSKTSDFNTNAESKTNTFNDNATQKTTDFNNNAQAKTEAFDEHTAEITADIEELQQEVEELSENMPWNTTEQATSVDITDAAKYSKNKIKVFGNTEQTQYSGINIDNTKLLSNATNSGVTREILEDGGVKITGTATGSASLSLIPSQIYGLPAGDYTLKVLGVPNDVTINIYYIGNITGEAVRKFTSDGTKNYNIVVALTEGVTYNFVAYPFLVSGNYTAETMPDYEPYVGGVPAPNPDYPQDIHVVTGNNIIGVTGKNIIRNDRETITTKGVTFTVNSDGSITAIGTSTSELDLYVTLGGAISLDQSKQYRLSGSPSTASSTTYRLMGKVTKQDNTYGYIADNTGNGVQLPLSAKAISVYINIKNGISINETFYPMVEEGTTKTSYEPYTHTDYPLNLGSLELCKIGNYQDYLYKENGNWYKYGAINKVVANSRTPFSKSTTTANTIYYKSNFVNALRNSGYCTGFTMKTVWGGSIIGCEIYNNINLRFGLGLNTDITTQEVFNEWLSNNPQTIYYIAATPSITQITDETLITQLDEIYEHLQLVKGTNNITVTASDLAPYMELTYMQDLPSKLDNLDSRLALLE